MAATSYESALQMAQSLSSQERLRLIRELSSPPADSPKTYSILDIAGLGAELWQQVDAQEYVRSERSSWAG